MSFEEDLKIFLFTSIVIFWGKAEYLKKLKSTGQKELEHFGSWTVSLAERMLMQQQNEIAAFTHYNLGYLVVMVGHLFNLALLVRFVNSIMFTATDVQVGGCQ